MADILIVIVSFSLGFFLGFRFTPRLVGMVESVRDEIKPSGEVPRARAVGVFKGKRKPKVNNDEKAWLIENNREV